MKKIYYLMAIGCIVFYSSLNAQWVQTNGPYGGCVRTFAVSGTNLFAGTSDDFGTSGDVFLSTNNGVNWKTVNNGMTDTSIFALVVSGTNLFAGTPFGGFFFH